MVEQLIVKLGLNAKGFHAGLARAQRGASMFNKALGVFGLGFAAAKLVDFAKKALSMADDLSTAAAKLGVTTDFLQEFRFAAEQSGISAESATMGFQRFSRRLAQAQQGGGELLSTLEQMGISMFNADGSARSSTEVFRDFADGIQATEDPSLRLLRAFKAFDSEGVALVAMLANGSKGFDELRQKAHEAGVVLEEDHIKNLDKADKSLKRFGEQAKIAFAKFVSSSIRSFKIAIRFSEKFFYALGANFDKWKNAYSKLFKLDFKGFAKAREEAMSNEESLVSIFREATGEIDEQLTIEQKLTSETAKRSAIIEQTTKQIAEQKKLQDKVAEQQEKLNAAKRERSLLTLEDLAKKEGKLEKTDPIVQQLKQQLAFAEKGLSPTGQKMQPSAQFERSMLLAEKVTLYEQLANALAQQGLFGRSQRAFEMADQIRKMTPHLKAGERNPLKVMEDQLKTAKDQLDTAKKTLEKIGVSFPLKMA